MPTTPAYLSLLSQLEELLRQPHSDSAAIAACAQQLTAALTTAAQHNQLPGDDAWLSLQARLQTLAEKAAAEQTAIQPALRRASTALQAQRAYGATPK